MLPRTLSDWSLELIVEVLERKTFESETFDFKERLPHSNDKDAKARLRRSCCAFANSDGGFLVFGIADNKALDSLGRVVGLPADMDFPEHFGTYPASCAPTIYWEFRNPALALDNGRLIHIVHIPRSWSAPHATGSLESGWYFSKRTNKGVEPMSLDEVRAGFLGFYEKRLKLQLLLAELATIRETAQSAFVSSEESVASHYSLLTFNTTVLETVIADTYSIVASEVALVQALMGIRSRASLANNKIRPFLSLSLMPIGGKDALVKNHNEFLKPICAEIVRLCDVSEAELKRLLQR